MVLIYWTFSALGRQRDLQSVDLQENEMHWRILGEIPIPIKRGLRSGDPGSHCAGAKDIWQLQGTTSGIKIVFSLIPICVKNRHFENP